MEWDEWIGAMDGRPTMWVKHLLCGFGCHIDLHKMVAKDDEACFHTHPAYAFRLVLWGGYTEQLDDFRFVHWFPGSFGIVRPETCHRIAHLLNARVSYSLWIRFRKCAPVRLRGEGWRHMNRDFQIPGTILESDQP